VSLWLNSGAPATEAARRAGHGVAVLLKIYAHCIDGQADTECAKTSFGQVAAGIRFVADDAMSWLLPAGPARCGVIVGCAACRLVNLGTTYHALQRICAGQRPLFEWEERGLTKK
jgi:hypothetical protein